MYLLTLFCGSITVHLMNPLPRLEVYMKYGVRNALNATVVRVKEGDVMSQIDCRLDATGNLSSVLSTDSVKELGLKEGDTIKLLVKAIHVIPVKE